MMPDFNSIESVYLILAFFVPGFIVSYFRAQFITGRMQSLTNAALSYLTLSVIYFALVFPALEYAIGLQEPSWQKAATWAALIFIGPAMFGIGLGLCAQKELDRKLLHKIGLNPVHIIPTAWDWKFGGMGEQWVLVVLKDGAQFAGYCGAKSFMSSDPEERDIYIEQVYEVDEDDNWHPRKNGVLIAGGEIRTVEFWPCDRIGDEK